MACMKIENGNTMNRNSIIEETMYSRISNMSLIIMAGGMSSRMGYCKALLPWGDSVLIVEQIRKGLAAGFQGIIISLGVDSDLNEHIISTIRKYISEDDWKQIRVVYDSIPSCGPIQGIIKSFQSTLCDWNLVIAVDMPFVDYQLLLSYTCGDYENVESYIPVHDGYSEPLAGVYHRSLLKSFITSYDNGFYALQTVLEKVKSNFVVMDAYRHMFMNMNTYEEYQWCRARFESEKRDVPIICVVASRRKTGKTTFIKKLVSELTRRHVVTGVIKSDAHQFTMDKEGSDTDEAIKAGAKAVMIASHNELAIRIKADYKNQMYHLSQILPVELVIMETRTQGVFPTIEVFRENYTEELMSPFNELVGLVEIDESSKIGEIEQHDIQDLIDTSIHVGVAKLHDTEQGEFFESLMNHNMDIMRKSCNMSKPPILFSYKDDTSFQLLVDAICRYIVRK